MSNTARGRRAEVLLLIYAIVNVALYSMLLPLWEGFDEPFHFGYVQTLANGAGFPDPRTSHLSDEVAQSIGLAPGSLSVQRNLPDVTAYPDFFALTESEREVRHRMLFQIDPESRWRPSKYTNYEGLQAPLAYAILALPERLLARIPLPDRVVTLRIFGGCLAALLLFAGARRLAGLLQLRPPYSQALIFCVFSSQMLFATVAHVDNDWLAVPLALWFLVSAMDYDERPTMKTAVTCAVILSLGLLTKAYFLAFLPLLFAICMLRRNIRQFAAVIIVLLAVAGPWYGRNLLRYGTISAMQELREGVHPAEAISAIQPGKIVPVIDSYLRSALWTGNNSFRSFSINTLEAVVVLWLAGLLLWITHKRVRREWIIAGYVCLFTAGLGYDAAINFVASHGETISPAPWYTQVLLAPMLALGMLGASRMPRPGRLVAAAMSLLFAYIIVATYWVKLIPLYSGITSRTSLSALPGIYSHVSALLTTLGEVSPGPATVILVCACIVTALAAGLAADTVSRLLKKHV